MGRKTKFLDLITDYEGLRFTGLRSLLFAGNSDKKTFYGLVCVSLIQPHEISCTHLL